MVTHCCHQVKQELAANHATPPVRLSKVPATVGGNPRPAGEQTSFKDPSGEAGKESEVSSRPRGAAGSAGERELLTAGDVARTIARMAHQVIEKTANGAESTTPPVLLGIPSRGTPL